MTGLSGHETGDWEQAARLLAAFDAGRLHLDDLLEEVPVGRARWLVMEAFRNRLVIDAILEPGLKRTPRPVAHNLLRLALAECLHREESARPKVVHHAIEAAKALRVSKPERGFLNAVLRRVLREGRLVVGDLEATHPHWMVSRWQAKFGESGTRQLLEWNQRIPDLHLHAAEQPAYAEPTQWPGYFRVIPTRFREALPDLEAGTVYMQDPFARIPVELLDPNPGEAVLDLCAAPGGKSRLIARSMEGRGQLRLVDRPGKRLERLRANAARISMAGLNVIACTLENLSNKPDTGLEPDSQDAVLIDVPCSNTGVMQKRPDVKLRLTEADISRHSREQLVLLKEAAAWVRPGGRLVYSTCSLEPEENDAVVDAFCEADPHWRTRQRVISLPWECGHDGGGAFLLTKGIPG